MSYVSNRHSLGIVTRDTFPAILPPFPWEAVDKFQRPAGQAVESLKQVSGWRCYTVVTGSYLSQERGLLFQMLIKDINLR